MSLPRTVVRAARGALAALRSSLTRRSIELGRLAGLPPRTTCQTNILGSSIALVDGPSFVSMYNEIFVRQLYEFRPTTDRPLILDCGANVGIATCWFKQRWPSARVVAFEADPAIARVLASNVLSLGLNQVEVVPAAIGGAAGTARFLQKGTDSGRISGEAEQGAGVEVPVVRLRDYLVDKVDLLKLDVEGAEFEALLDCGDRLGLVHALFVEYHSFSHRSQELDRMLALLKGCGFRYYVNSAYDFRRRPFVDRGDNQGMDCQVNIFAYRS